MIPDRLRRVRELFDRAHDIPKVGRSSFVTREAAGDSSLVREVMSLLAQSETDSAEHQSSPADLPVTDTDAHDGQATSFEAGEIIAGRYEIVRMVGQGGMGQVFEVRDLDLSSRLALKTLHVSKATEGGFVERLKRETALARRIAHPNVCRVFDFGVHRSSDRQEDDEGVHFMTMELLHGQSLAERLRTSGPISSEETLSLCGQLVSGLGAAHAAGVVHRDFKPSNVIIVPLEGNQVKAVITDFGVARGIALADSQRTNLTATGTILGTPAYMSPEQVIGQEATPASDLYSLGLVMYEMLSGELPFTGASPMSIAIKRVEASRPPCLSDKIPHVDRRLEKVVARCLERNPEDRFATAEDMARALHGERVGLPPRVRRTILRWAGVSLLLILILTAAGYWLLRYSVRGRWDLAVRRPSLTVLSFGNASTAEESHWIATAARDLLVTHLTASGAFRVVPVESMGAMQDSMGAGGGRTDQSGRLRFLRTSFGIDYAVIGTCELVIGDGAETIRVEFGCMDLENGRTVMMLEDSGRPHQLYDIVDRYSTRLREVLVPGRDAMADSAQLRAVFSLDPAAARLYAEGLDALRVFDAEKARTVLSDAAVISPSSPQIHAALADAWEALGHQTECCDEAERSFNLSAKLPREIRMGIEARHRACANDWHRAVDIRRALFTFFPDEIERGLDLADVQVRSGDGAAALATLASLRASLPHAAIDPRLRLAEANAYESVGEFRKAQAAAEESADLASGLGASFLEAQALRYLGWALYQQGEYDRALEVLTDARARFEQAGNRGAAMATLSRMSGSLGALGRFEEMRTNCMEIIEFWDRLGNKRGAARARVNLANALDALHRRREAIRVNREAIAVLREIGDLEAEGWATANAGQSALQEGDLTEAHEFMEQALAIARLMKNESIEGDALLNLSSVEIEMGDMAAARESARAGAEIFDRLGLACWSLAAQINLAEIERRTGNIAEAEGVARGAMTRAAGGECFQETARLEEILTLLLLAKGEPRLSREALDSAMQNLAKAGIEKDAWASIAKARVTAAEGNMKAALAGTRQLLNDVGPDNVHGLGVTFEVRLCLGELEIMDGQTYDGRRHLGELARDARKKGFKSIERAALRATAD